MRWRRLILAGLLGVLVLGPMACTSIVLPRVDDRVPAVPANPPLFAPEDADLSWADWRAKHAPALLAAFEANIYGAPPPPRAPEVLARRTLDAAAFEGRAIIEEIDLKIGAGYGEGVTTVALALPAHASGPVPVIIAQTFCGNRAAFRGRPDILAPRGPYPSMCDGGSLQPLVTAILGKHISSPPFEAILDRGYAIAYFYPGDIVPDSAEHGPPALHDLERFGAGSDLGAIAAWAWLFSRVVDVFDMDPRLDPARTAVWGHSRNGKSALLAAALDPRIDLAIVHQSGTGGATLTRSYDGESVAKITEAYPHWFAPSYASFAGREDALPVDQHQLIALVAPRPIFFGNARRDKWSDPHGAFRALQAADAAYKRAGASGLRQASMAPTDLSGELAFFIRSGNHGVTEADWAAFLDFLDAHAPGAPSPASPALVGTAASP